jgi:hypothetical protein
VASEEEEEVMPDLTLEQLERSNGTVAPLATAIRAVRQEQACLRADLRDLQRQVEVLAHRLDLEVEQRADEDITTRLAVAETRLDALDEAVDKAE